MRIFLYAVQGYVNWVCRVGDRGNQGKESGGLFYLAVHTRHWQVIWILVTRTTLFLRVIDSSVYRRGNGVRTLGLKQLQKQTTSRSTVALSCGRLFTFGIIPQTGRWINVRCQRPRQHWQPCQQTATTLTVMLNDDRRHHIVLLSEDPIRFDEGSIMFPTRRWTWLYFGLACKLQLTYGATFSETENTRTLTVEWMGTWKQ